MGHLGHLSRPGHRVINSSHCQVSVVGLKSLDVSELLLLPMIIKNSLAREYFFTHKSTFGVRYRAGSPGQLGLRVAGFPSHWVAGSQNVTQFHLCSKHRPTASDKDDRRHSVKSAACVYSTVV